MVTDQEISLRESVRMKELLVKVIAKNTGQKLEKVKADMERDHWMSADEAVKYGLADAIIRRGR